MKKIVALITSSKEEQEKAKLETIIKESLEEVEFFRSYFDFPNFFEQVEYGWNVVIINAKPEENLWYVKGLHAALPFALIIVIGSRDQLTDMNMDHCNAFILTEEVPEEFPKALKRLTSPGS